VSAAGSPAWQPAATLPMLAARAQLLAAARGFFAERGVIEVETPALVAHAVPDPHLANITVVLAGPPPRGLYLHTSPEYHMKRLLAAGAPDIFQLGKVWRDGERGRWHAPEFTLLEWYRHDCSLAALAAEVVDLVRALCGAAGCAAPQVSETSYASAFRATAGIDPLAAPLAEVRARAAAVLGARVDASLTAALGDDRNAWLDLLLTHAVAPALSGLWVVTDYPADQAMMARRKPADPRVAERFEVFWDGLELANGYRELTDSQEQSARFAADRAARQAGGLPDVIPDEALLAALAAGLPDCAGVAVGFDRVVARVLGAAGLDAVLSFVPGADGLT
jgi:lysyl-tRNA synthetase class 2